MRRILHGRAGVLALVLLTLGLWPDWPPKAYAAVTGQYDVALLRVQFSDATGMYSVANLNTAATELHDFFDQLSYGQLNMQVRVADVSLSGRWND